ncbi:hypothetical protein JMG10_26740 [Nostoc ellipsosporum NOK]|nr:hypothetical protein [Nostoc ellipsosporum NOK]
MKAGLAAALMLVAPGIARAQDAPVPHYLPPDFAGEEGGFYESWFGRHLAAMEEPVLGAPHALDGYRIRFRMLVLPSFLEPYVIGVDERTDGRHVVRYTRTDGRGGYGPGPIAERRIEALAGDRFVRVADALADARLAERLPSNRDGQEFAGDVPRADMVICLDGTQFVFELLDGAGHHVVTRHDCSLDGPIRALVDATQRAAGLLRRKRRSD